MAFGPYPEFSWSFSRDDLFKECKRKYFYTYYGSWGGWAVSNGNERARMLYRYKNTTNLHLAFGTHVHDLIKECISTDFYGDFESILRKRMQDTCKKGKDIESWLLRPRRNPALMEVLFWGGFSSEKTKKTVRDIDEKMKNAQNFFKTKTMQELKDCESIIEIDEDLFDTSFGKMFIDDVLVYAKVDLLYKRKDGKYVIVDLKTGKTQNKFTQMYLYADYVNKRHNVPVEDIICRFENITTGTNVEIEDITQEKIDELEEYIRQSIHEMKEYLDGEKPKTEESFLASPLAYRCEDCCFQSCCKKENNCEK